MVFSDADPVGGDRGGEAEGNQREEPDPAQQELHSSTKYSQCQCQCQCQFHITPNIQLLMETFLYNGTWPKALINQSTNNTVLYREDKRNNSSDDDSDFRDIQFPQDSALQQVHFQILG